MQYTINRLQVFTEIFLWPFFLFTDISKYKTCHYFQNNDENNITANEAFKADLFDSINTTTNHNNVC